MLCNTVTVRYWNDFVLTHYCLGFLNGFDSVCVVVVACFFVFYSISKKQSCMSMWHLVFVFVKMGVFDGKPNGIRVIR